MSSFYNKTPLLRQIFQESRAPQVFIKYEFLQPSGSFKSRGIGHLISKRAQLIREKKKVPVVFSSSGGNAGLAAAVTCHMLNISCTVVIPTTTKKRMAEKIRKCGANVIVEGSHWKEADCYLRDLLTRSLNKNEFESIYVHPFDDPIIWKGHATIVDEIISSLGDQQVPLEKVKGIVCSVGGGGLYNGVIQGLEKHGLANTIPVVAVETRGCHVLNESLQKGVRVEFGKASSVATSLCSTHVAAATFDNAQKYDSKSLVLEDKEVLQTCLKYANNFNIITEPACGASLHLAYNPLLLERALGINFSPDDVIIVIACGGSAATIEGLKTSLQSLS